MAYVVRPVEEQHDFGIQRLQALVRATCLRRTKQQTLDSGLLSLPQRFERIEYVRLHTDDQGLYDLVKRANQKLSAGLDTPLQKDASERENKKNVMVLLNSLRLICDHGKELVPRLAKSIMEKSSLSIIDRNQEQTDASSCSSCGGESDRSSAFTGPRDFLCINCANSETTTSDIQYNTRLETRKGASAYQIASIDGMGSATKPSAKVVALIKNLRQEASISDPTNKPRKRYIPHPNSFMKT